MQSEGSPRRLRALLATERLLVVPGAYECITARLVQRSGFQAVYMTGAGTAATYGYPDYGLATMTEMVGNARRIAAAVDIPVIADADTGYGGELNVVRTVREYERAGVAGIHIEDQAFPKRCGHLEGKAVIPLTEYVAKIRAAVESRRDPDFVIIARTDARAPEGLDAAVTRASAALAAGADLAFVEAPETVEEVATIPARVGGPCLLNLVLKGKSPELTLDEAERYGYRVAILPGVLLAPVVGACEAALDELRTTRRHPRPPGDLTVREMFRRFGADEWDDLRDRF